MVRDSFVSVYNKLDPENKINSFELFGYDFMIDENFKVYLIEANTNPWLEINWTLLSSIISSVVDNTFRIVLDSFFWNPLNSKDMKRRIGLWDSSNTLSKFELVFDEQIEKESLSALNSKLKQTENEWIEEEIDQVIEDEIDELELSSPDKLIESKLDELESSQLELS